MSDLRALAERLEKATGADREIDRQLHVALTEPVWSADTLNVPAYTSSLDAAMALCERVLGWRILLEIDGAKICAVLRQPGKPGYRRIESAYAPTPALALCLAVVRAKLAEAE